MPSNHLLQRLASVLYLMLILSTCLCRRLASQDCSIPTYHGATSEVRLVFFASDGHNRNPENLTTDDFAVIDNDEVIRNFRSFGRSVLTHLDVIVLFDSSESVLPYFKQEVDQVLGLAAEWSRQPDCDVSVLSFSGIDTHQLCHADCGSTLTAERMLSLSTGGATPLFDALDTATALLRNRARPNTLPVIILFSDGDDTVSRGSLHRTLEQTLAAEVQVYVVDLNHSASPSNGTATLKSIADASGGLYFRFANGIAAIFSTVADDLHSASLVTYALPSSHSDFHSLRILPTRNLNLRFRTRSGYFQSGITAKERNP